VVPPLTKTPLFQAINAGRYQRQALIREIQHSSGAKLICYVAGIGAPVDREDVVCFVDLLHNIAPGQDVDLLLQTGGGDIDAAEKLITMVRKKVGTARLRVIVPDYAKSAGTLMALGADIIVMSDTSELGPIDPQIVRSDHNGNRVWHSVKNYIDAYEEHKAALKEDPTNVTAQMMLSKLDPETVQLFNSTMLRARAFAESQLKRGMMLKGGNWSQAVSALLNTTRFQTHGQPISWEDASDPTIGLTVEYRRPDDELWLQYWQLYCLQLLSVKDNQKLFESDFASLCIDSRAA
jgi:membrane-bound ClpP family serine protease